MLSEERQFFEIPVYRCAPDDLYAELDREKARLLSPEEHLKAGSTESYAFSERYIHKAIFYPWDFNETVGFLRLYPLGTQLRGEIWSMEGKRIRRGTRRKIRWVGKAFELQVRENESNSEISSRLLSEVNAVTLEPPFVGRYVDTRCLANACIAMDWHKLLK